MTSENKKRKILLEEYQKNTHSGFHIEIDKIINGVAVCVNGVSSVLDFGEERAILKLRRGKLRVEGRELTISVYENKTAEISGKVEKIEFI